jgi:hypothetical protein
MNAANLKANLFWVVCGALALVLVLLYMFLLKPKQEEFDKTLANIKGGQRKLQTVLNPEAPELKGVPVGDPDIQRWNAHRQELIKKLEQVVKFYVDHDGSFEEWLPELSVKPGEVPNPGTFLSEWKTAINKVNEAARISDEADSGLRWETITDADLSKPAKDRLMKDLMKSFWIRQRVWESLRKIADREKAAGKRQTQILEVAWVQSVYSKPEYGLTPPPEFPPDRNTPSKYPGLSLTREFSFPGELGRTMTFGAELRIRLSDLPVFLSALLDPNAKPAVFVELLGVRIEPDGVNEFSRTVPVPSDNQDAAMEEHEKKQEPQFIRAVVTARILDFDRAKLEEKEKLIAGLKGQ